MTLSSAARALLLAAGELFGIAFQKWPEAETFDQLALPCGIMSSGDARLEGEIIGNRERRDQVELLEHQAKPITAECGALGILQPGDGDVAQHNFAAVGLVETGNQMQQRALAAAALAGERNTFTGGNSEIDAAENRNVFLRGTIGFGEVADREHVRPS